nr:MAG TPA: hypothetical protein [Caudoviricetes sp.]
MLGGLVICINNLRAYIQSKEKRHSHDDMRAREDKREDGRAAHLDRNPKSVRVGARGRAIAPPPREGR